MKANVLLVDGNNLAHRCYYSLSKLNNYGKPVSVIYGLPNLVGKLVKKFNPKRVYIVWDGRKSKIRKELLPTYKERKPQFNFDPEDFYKQRDTVMKVFHRLGVKQLYDPTQEADDVIAFMARRFADFDNRKTVIASNDKDFHQLISKNLSVFTAQDILLNHLNLTEHFPYSPTQCVDYLCMVGDDSDKIPGYRGIGPVGGKDFLNQFSSIENFLNSEDSFKKVDKSKLEATYLLNRQLIDLRFYVEKHMGNYKPVYYKGNKAPELNKMKLFKICEKYHINSFRKKQFLQIWL